MPRGARKVAESGFYHVMLRGNGGQIIFDDDADRRAFLAALSVMLEDPGLSLIAWCLMSTHAHLLLSDETGALSSAMHGLATRYAGRFNSRTGHIGSVFAGRFKSVPVETDSQLVAAVRYIHNNPEKAGICPAAEFAWSSYREYVGEPFITNVDVVLDLVGGAAEFASLSAEGRPVGYCFRAGKRIPDEDAFDIARAVTYPADPRALASEGGVERGRVLLALRDAGLTLKQIVRITGIGRYAIEKGILLASEG
ncbi:MAG TPA: transposase [Candidatus Olsenella pullicola]|nr:transposase [Candidatus Olsenella pullicola]